MYMYMYVHFLSLSLPPSLPLSFPSQLAKVQESLAVSEDRVNSLQSALSTSREKVAGLEEQLASAEEKQLSMEQSKELLERVGAERLAAITALQSEVEGGRAREGLVGELKEQLSSLEQLLHSLQEEVSFADLTHSPFSFSFFVSSSSSFFSTSPSSLTFPQITMDTQFVYGSTLTLSSPHIWLLCQNSPFFLTGNLELHVHVVYMLCTCTCSCWCKCVGVHQTCTSCHGVQVRALEVGRQGSGFREKERCLDKTPARIHFPSHHLTTFLVFLLCIHPEFELR